MMKNNYYLNIKYRDIEQIFEAMKQLFMEQYKVILTKDNKVSLSRGNSVIQDKKAWIGEMGIGNRNIVKFLNGTNKTKAKSKVTLNTRITDIAFVVFVTSGFHELQHFSQSENELQGIAHILDKHKELDVLMGIQWVATSQNKLHYHSNYKYNISEVDAEKHGFENGFEFLTNLYPDKREILEQIFAEVYNYKASAIGYCLNSEHKKSPFKTYDDIEKAFENTLVKLCDREYVGSHSKYPVVMSDTILSDDENIEINKALLRAGQLSKNNKGWEDIYCGIIGTRGYLADKQLAAIVNYFYPQIKKQYAVLDNVDLSMTTVFGFEPKTEDVKEEYEEVQEENIEKKELIPNTSNLKLWMKENIKQTENKNIEKDINSQDKGEEI